jgi:hypothetical protein
MSAAEPTCSSVGLTSFGDPRVEPFRLIKSAADQLLELRSAADASSFVDHAHRNVHVVDKLQVQSRVLRLHAGLLEPVGRIVSEPASPRVELRLPIFPLWIGGRRVRHEMQAARKQLAVRAAYLSQLRGG